MLKTVENQINFVAINVDSASKQQIAFEKQSI